MGNALKGEVTLEVGAKMFTIVMDINAMCLLEDKMKLTTAEIIEQMSGLEKNLRLNFLRDLVWAGLQEKHEGLSVKQAGGIVRDHGLPETLAKVVESFKRAFPSAAEDAGDGGPRKPPETDPADGTGPTSTEPGTTSA